MSRSTSSTQTGFPTAPALAAAHGDIEAPPDSEVLVSGVRSVLVGTPHAPGSVGTLAAPVGTPPTPGPDGAKLLSREAVQARIDAFFDGVESVLAVVPEQRRAA